MFVLKDLFVKLFIIASSSAVSILDGREFVGMERIREDPIFIYLGAYGSSALIAITNQSCCR